jgi:hypothetical protein
MVGSDGESDDALHSIAKLACDRQEHCCRVAYGQWFSDAQPDRGFRSPVMLGWQFAWRDSPQGAVVGGCRSSPTPGSSPIGGSILFRSSQTSSVGEET